MAEKKLFPGWRYGPSGTKAIFDNADEVPEGWARSPEGPFGEAEKEPSTNQKAPTKGKGKGKSGTKAKDEKPPKVDIISDATRGQTRAEVLTMFKEDGISVEDGLSDDEVVALFKEHYDVDSEQGS